MVGVVATQLGHAPVVAPLMAGACLAGRNMSEVPACNKCGFQIALKHVACAAAQERCGYVVFAGS